jgi:hypothetical protein
MLPLVAVCGEGADVFVASRELWQKALMGWGSQAADCALYCRDSVSLAQPEGPTLA